MKRKIIIPLTVFLIVFLGIVFAQTNPSADNQYAIISYTLGRNGMIDIYQGTSNLTASVKCKGANLDCVVDLLDQYKERGFKVVSMTTNPRENLLDGYILLSKN